MSLLLTRKRSPVQYLTLSPPADGSGRQRFMATPNDYFVWVVYLGLFKHFNLSTTHGAFINRSSSESVKVSGHAGLFRQHHPTTTKPTPLEDFPDSRYLNDSGNGKIYRPRRYRSLYCLYTKVFCGTNF